MYLTAIALGSTLVVASIVVELFVRRPEPRSAAAPDHLACNREVGVLFDELGQLAGTLFGDVALGLGETVASRWDESSRAWQRRWAAVGERCRFDELEGTGLGQAFDRMATVHRTLPVVRLRHRESLARFAAEPGAELAEMRRALDKSRALLEERARTEQGFDP